MLLAGLILLAACANLGSLFAARAADRSREVALRLALGASRSRILRRLFTEALLISLVGGAARTVGQRSAVARAERVAASSQISPSIWPVNPDANVYVVALLLTLVSGFLFGAVPVRQVLQHGSIRDRQVGIRPARWAADYCPGPVAGRANCDLRGAGHFFDGCGARTGALAAQQFRF